MTTLIWLNGPNGIGKTQVAFALQHRLPASFVCDPEHLGFAMRKMLPGQIRVDFRELPQWRHGVNDVLSFVLDKVDEPLIAPMTVLDIDMIAEMTASARASGHEVHHVTLLASRKVLMRRIYSRGETSRGWTARQIDHTLPILRAPEFARHLQTDDLSIAEVAENIAMHAGLTLAPDTDGILRRRARQLVVKVRHTRFGA